MRKRFFRQHSRCPAGLRPEPANHRLPVMIGAATISLLILLTSPGCSPYPMYTHGSLGTTESGDGSTSRTGTATESQGRGRSGSAEDRQDSQRPGVDPAIFTHVVNDYLGAPYKRGGDDEKGFDCSHLVRAVYADYSGTRLPASTRALYELPEEVTREELVVGDLVFFSFDDLTISHVGIYMGGGRFVHASESRGVIISSLSDPDFLHAYKGARRVL